MILLTYCFLKRTHEFHSKYFSLIMNRSSSETRYCFNQNHCCLTNHCPGRTKHEDYRHRRRRRPPRRPCRDPLDHDKTQSSYADREETPWIDRHTSQASTDQPNRLVRPYAAKAPIHEPSFVRFVSVHWLSFPRLQLRFPRSPLRKSLHHRFRMSSVCAAHLATVPTVHHSPRCSSRRTARST